MSKIQTFISPPGVIAQEIFTNKTKSLVSSIFWGFNKGIFYVKAFDKNLFTNII